MTTNIKILKDTDGNGIPQYIDKGGIPQPLLGDKAPYSHVVDESSEILFGTNKPGKVEVVQINPIQITDGTNTLAINSDGTIKSVEPQSVIVLDGESVGAGSTVIQTDWMDCLKFHEMEIMVSSTQPDPSVSVAWSHDGVTTAVTERDVIPIVTGLDLEKVTTNPVRIKARYAKVVVVNNSASLATISCWAYLKP